jgi:hypothetical protein
MRGSAAFKCRSPHNPKIFKYDVKRWKIDKFERRFVIKFLLVKGLRSKTIHTKLETTLGATIYSPTQVKEWFG